MFSFVWKGFRFAWRWSPVLTLPITLLFLVWTNAVINTYWDFGLRYNTLSNAGNLRRIMEYEFESVVRKGRLIVRGNGDLSAEEAPKVQLWMSEEDQARLDSRLPETGRNYVDGFLQYPDGQLLQVDMRYRGDFFWHWAMRKKSWRVKTSKTAMWNHMRKFNLIVPKTPAMVGGDLGYWLARDMGLIAPESEVVELWINGEPRGAHTQVEQLEELVIRKNGRMPGDLFTGELVQRDAYTGRPGRVFQFPGIWEKVAINNHFDDDANSSIVRLCELVQAEPSEEVYAELRTLLNYEAFGLFTAYRQLTQSGHYDNAHNWRLYYDPWRNRFEPVVWDPNAWHKNWLPDSPELAFEMPFFCELDDVLARDDQYRLASSRALTQYLSQGSEERLLRHYDDRCRSVAGAVRRDPDLAQFFKPVEETQVEQAMVELRSQIQSLWSEYADRHFAQAPSVALRTLWSGHGEHRVRIALSDYQPIEGLAFEFEQPVTALPKAFLGYVDGKGERVDVDISGAVILEGTRVRVRVPLMPGFRMEAREARSFVKRKAYIPQVRTYDLRIVFEDKDTPSPITTRYEASNGRTGPLMVADDLEAVSVGESFSVVLPNRIEQPQRWSGNIRISGQDTIRDVVIIEPGTVLEMEAGASVIFENKVLARGTKEMPIIVRPAIEGQEPWGVLAIRGSGANQSQLSFCTMYGGSGWKLPLAEYSAMLSIHNVADVRVEDCHFRDSQVVDDMVHAVYATDILFRNCLFERSLFDSLDIDISNGRVESCDFVDSGNDSLDLMTSTVVVTDTKVVGSKDKAFSVGEGSHLILKNSLMDSCLLGVEVKDGSSAFIVHCDFVGNGIALNTYKKNWRYNDGGDVHAHKCWFDKNDETATADKNSRVFIGNSYYLDSPESSRRVTLGPRNRSGEIGSKSRYAQPGGFVWLPGEPDPVKRFMANDWPVQDSKRRGVPKDLVVGRTAR